MLSNPRGKKWLAPIVICIAILVGFLLYASGLEQISITILCTLGITCYYHNMVRLYPKCDQYMGGIPLNRTYYLLGFFVAALGLTGIMVGPIIREELLAEISLVLFVIGTVFSTYATKKLFDRILTRGIL
jgi:hypothetical protein